MEEDSGAGGWQKAIVFIIVCYWPIAFLTHELCVSDPK